MDTIDTLWICLTYRSNLPCKYHIFNKRLIKVKKEASIGEFKEVMNAIDLKGSYIKLSGGEPFLREGIIDFLVFLEEKKPKDMFIETNESLLTPKIIKRFAKYQNISLSVSLDSADETHDSIWGKRGLYRDVINNLKNILKRNICVEIITTLQDKNIEKLSTTIKKIWEMDVSNVRILPILNVSGEKEICDAEEMYNYTYSVVIPFLKRYPNNFINTNISPAVLPFSLVEDHKYKVVE